MRFPLAEDDDARDVAIDCAVGKATKDREDHASQIGADHAPQSGSMETAFPK